MYNTKNLIGLPVLSLYEGELVGNISKIFFDKKLKKVMYFSITGESDMTYMLSPKHIYKIGKNAITIKNNACLSLSLESEYPDTIPSPFESKAYTIQGEYIGKITHITFNEKFYVDTVLLDNDKSLDCSNLASCSKNTILVYDENTRINISKFKHRLAPKIFKTKQPVDVVALPIIEENIDSLDKVELPITATNNPTFLIGRTVLQDIFLQDKTLLIKANSTVTERTLALAMTNNKVKDLMLYSKQK